MTLLPVKKLPASDSGRLLVRLNYEHRVGVDRYGIAKLTNNNNSKSQIVLMLGHEEDDAIFMPYDIRTALKVNRGSELDFSIAKVGRWGKLCWYIGSPDPAVHVSAWIAVGGLGLAITGLIIGIVSIF